MRNKPDFMIQPVRIKRMRYAPRNTEDELIKWLDLNFPYDSLLKISGTGRYLRYKTVLKNQTCVTEAEEVLTFAAPLRKERRR